MEKASAQLKTISEDDYAKVKTVAGIVKSPRSFIFKTPEDHGMTGWKDIYIPSDDGTPLEGWYPPGSCATGKTSARCARQLELDDGQSQARVALEDAGEAQIHINSAG